MQFNTAQRELTIKVVYYGPPLSGKTTNLQAIHQLLDPRCCGQLTVLDTADDRTLFFDLLPLSARMPSGYGIKLKLFTVPGQVIHAATRRIVLAGADGVVFVADSQVSQSRANNQFWHGMRHYLAANGINPDDIPVVIQFNKRDLPDARPEEELEEVQRRGPEPIYTAVAIRGEGVVETLEGLMGLVFTDLNRRYGFESKFQVSSQDFLSGLFGQASHRLARPIVRGA